MNWLSLTNEQQFTDIFRRSHSEPFAIFKHSTRCSVSLMAKRNLEQSWDAGVDALPIYFLDLLAHRSISDLIAQTLGVIHQSPQLIVVQNGKAVYFASHHEIDAGEAVNAVLQK